MSRAMPTQAAALSGMYTAKFELFHVVQALDRVKGVRDMPELYRAYEECLDVAVRRYSDEYHAETRKRSRRL